MVEEASFEDLYYRLNSVVIKLPPLRDRKDDIALLANRFVQDYCMEYGVNILNISAQVMGAFMFHDWQGNVRELSNVIERMVVIAKNNHANSIDTSFLPDNISLKANRVDKGEKDPSDVSIYDLNKILEIREKR